MARREVPQADGATDSDLRPRRRGGARRLLALAAALALGAVALVPQIQLWAVRGRGWAGHAATVHPDEAAYRAYVNALIEGRPRRNDPYTGRDREMNDGRVETLFSIQFAPAYAVALPARLFGVSSAWAFIALSFLTAFLSTLALERLLAALVGRGPGGRWLAATGALFVLSFGALARAQKVVYWLTGQQTPFTPLLFLRRYLPAAPFPLFFVFCLLVWAALARPDRRGALARAAGAGAVFALLVYSYFYLWTAALAWIACLAALWLAFRRDGRRRAAEVFAVVGASMIAALVPYALMLARRPASMDEAQLLVHTRAPDLFRPPELIGLACAAVLAYAARRKLLAAADPALLFAASFALTPLLVFNQQIATGLSLQPIHYELFNANYLALLSAVVAAALLWRARAAAPARGGSIRAYPRRTLAALAFVSVAWAVFEISLVTWRYRYVNYGHDDRYAAAARLREIARAGAGGAAGGDPVVFSADTPFSDWQPGVAPQPVLWAAHMTSFGGLPPEVNRERLYTQFYYMGVDGQEFAGPMMRRHRGSLFGWGRVGHGLVPDFSPVTDEEIRAETDKYLRFVSAFDRARAARPVLSHAVVPEGVEVELTNLDRWYERGAGERVGRFVIYPLRLRP